MPRSRPKTSDKSTPTAPGPLTVFLGLFLIGSGVFLLVSFATSDITIDPASAARACPTGLVGAWAAYLGILTLGAASAYTLALLLIAWGAHLAHGAGLWRSWPQVLGGLILLPALAATVHLLFGLDAACGGGLVAHVLCPPAQVYLGQLGLLILSLGTLFCGAVLCFGDVVFDLGARAGRGLWHAACTAAAWIASAISFLMLITRPRLAALWVTSADRALVAIKQHRAYVRQSSHPEEARDFDEAADADDATEPEGTLEVEAAVVDEPATPAGTPAPRFDTDTSDADAGFGDEDEQPSRTRTDRPVRASAAGRTERAAGRAAAAHHAGLPNEDNPDYQLPPLNLLDRRQPSHRPGSNMQRRAQVLEKTLAEFKIDGRVVQVQRGPRVTLYEMTLAPGIRLTRVINLADNIAMALKASNVRIIAPIPGKDTIGIEVPNVSKELVTLREIIEAVNREDREQILPVCLAKDVGGQPLIGDLTVMPHLLIAGATGSGKSVCINSIILSLLMCCKPHEVKLILVDPKVVELSRFKDVPHLMSPVVTDMKRAVSVLEWACQKMDERYEQLFMVNVNHIAKFNALGPDAIADRLAGVCEPDELDLFPKQLPYIVIVIDELADLMLVAGKEVETLITRLAAKSRAVGIHVIFATQRPSVDVITGLIKANMPCRIAFQVASKVDSRTILDQNGAETLLGAGDMLYLPPGIGKVVRAQGVFVTDEELFRVKDFCKDQQPPVFHADLETLASGVGNQTDVSDFDELFAEAGAAIIESGRGSVSLLQRKLGIGYGRASRIIDQLASVAVLGPFREGKAREIFMTLDEFNTKFAGGQSSLGFQDTGEADEDWDPPESGEDFEDANS